MNTERLDRAVAWIGANKFPMRSGLVKWSLPVAIEWAKNLWDLNSAEITCIEQRFELGML